MRLFSALIMAAFVFAAGQGAVSAAPDDEGDSAISVTVEIPESDTTDPTPDPDLDPTPDPEPSPDPDDGDKAPPADPDPDAGSDELPRTGFSTGTVLWVAFALVVAGAATRLGITAFRRQYAR